VSVLGGGAPLLLVVLVVVGAGCGVEVVPLGPVAVDEGGVVVVVGGADTGGVGTVLGGKGACGSPAACVGSGVDPAG
jgi:hypothetical protein